MVSKRPLKVLILGLNYAPELVGIAIYTSGLAEALATQGHNVTVIAGKPYYPSWQVQSSFRGAWLRRSVENQVNVARVAHYVPKVPSGLLRIVHHLSFALSSLLPTLFAARSARPDIVFTVAPSLIAAPVAKLAAKVSGASSWLHIQDFEAEAAIATGLIREGSAGARVAHSFERSVMRMFDRVSSISPAMCKKLIDKGVSSDRIIEFRNWADITEIRPLTKPSAFRSEWAISTPHVALYSGNIANKQGIEIIVSAARLLLYRNDITFVICGDGPTKDNLQKSAGGLPNLIFKPLQPKEKLESLLGLASVHLLPQASGAADLVLPSKLANMLASGRPVVATANVGTSLAAEVAGCGLVVPPEDSQAFAAAIERLIDNDSECLRLGAAARLRAVQHWERVAIISRLENEMRIIAT